MHAIGIECCVDGPQLLAVPSPEPVDGEGLPRSSLEAFGTGVTPAGDRERAFDRGATTIKTADEPVSHEER